MELHFERSDGVLCVGVNGRVDADTANVLWQDTVDQFDGSDRRLVLNLAGVSYVSSAGLQAFLLLARSTVQADIEFAVSGLSDDVRDVLEIAGFDFVLPIFPDSADVVAGPLPEVARS